MLRLAAVVSSPVSLATTQKRAGWIIPLAGMLLLGLTSPPVHAADPDYRDSPRTVTPTVQKPADELVRQLGSADYALREGAMRELSQLGLAAHPALIRAQASPDLEVRTRVKQLLVVVNRLDLQRRLQAFVADHDNKLSHDLPMWNLFRERIGDDPAARQLFAEILQLDNELYSAMELEPRRRTELLRQHVAMLNMSLNIDGNANKRGFPAVASMLFLAGEPQIEFPEEAQYQLHNVVQMPAFQQAISNGPQVELAKKVLACWLMRPSLGNLGATKMSLAARYKIPHVMLPQAVHLLQQPSGNQAETHFALYVVGSQGNKEHLPLIDKFRENKSVCVFVQHNRVTVQVQLRDVALWGLVRIAGEEFKDYGYETTNFHMPFLNQAVSYQFLPDAEIRTRAFARWDERHPAPRHEEPATAKR